MADDGKQKSGGRRMGCFGALMLMLVIFGAIGSIGAAVYLHTEDGRKAMEERVSKWFGMDLTLGSATVGWPGCLVLRDIESVPPDPRGQPLFRVREVRVGVGHGLRWKMELYRPALTLMRNSDGGWVPGCFGRIGELPNMRLADVGPLTEDLREALEIEVDEGTVRWMGEEGRETAAATGVSIRMRPVDISNRRMYHYTVIMQTVTRRDGSRVYDVQREWLSSVELEYVELYRSVSDGLQSQEIW